MATTHRKRKPARRIQEIRIETLKTDADLATRAARQRGGVRVVDELGQLLFRLTIPTTPLPE